MGLAATLLGAFADLQDSSARLLALANPRDGPPLAAEMTTTAKEDQLLSPPVPAE